MPPDTPVDAGVIPQRQFSTARRGLDPGEVRAYLHQLSEIVSSLQSREADAQERAERAEERAARAQQPDHHMLVEMLGDETARVLDAARDAATDIREKAEAAAARLIQEANEQAHELRAAGEAEVLAQRARMLADVDELRQQAEVELERRRAEGDQLVAEMRREGQAVADGLRQEAEKERATATVEAEDIREAARREARRLVTEARTMRERVLGDLSRRRRAAREQLERLNAARDRLLAAYEVVRRTVDEATAELTIALPEAKVASDTAQRRVRSEPELSLEEMESQVSMARMAGLLPPLPDGADAGIDALLDPEPEGAPGPDEAPDEVLHPDDVLDEVLHPDDVLADDELADDVLDDGAGEREPAWSDTLGDLLADAREMDEPEVGLVPDDAGEPVAERVFTTSVDDVFARLKGGGGGHTPDHVLLRQRDETLEPLDRALSRRLKRVLADEQNEVMDLVRRGGTELDDLLPEAETHAARYGDVVADEVHTAAYWGAAAVEGEPAGSCDHLAAELGRAVTAPLRDRIARSAAESEDADELTDRLRALYREWKNEHLATAVRHVTAAAYALGVYEAIPDGTLLRWVVDSSTTPCPDAEENARAGPVGKGEAFPTGHCAPPSHTGCRCSIVPVAGGRGAAAGHDPGAGQPLPDTLTHRQAI